MAFRARYPLKMRKRAGALTLTACLSLQLYGIDPLPWLSEVYSARSAAGFEYYYFNKISGAIKNKSYPSNNYLTFAGAGFTPSKDIDVDCDLELVRTPRQNYSFRSSAVQFQVQIS
jgi:hypothetical protein